jgi:hypothetical protein
MSRMHDRVEIDVPAVPEAEAGPGDAESRTVASNPAFQQLIAEGREAFARGEGIAAEDVFRELGLDDQDDVRQVQPDGGHPNGQPRKQGSIRKAIKR